MCVCVREKQRLHIYLNVSVSFTTSVSRDNGQGMQICAKVMCIMSMNVCGERVPGMKKTAVFYPFTAKKGIVPHQPLHVYIKIYASC